MLLVFGSTVSSFSCEICGCGVGNFYMGNLPRFKTSFIGLRYHYMRYQTVLASDPSQFSNDYYKTAELWGGINLGSRWQALVFAPYRINRKVSDDGIVESSGLGDISVLAQYSLLHTRTAGTRAAIDQQLWLGAGLKFATGKYHLALSDPDANIGDANSQAGTGSTDILLTAMHTLNTGRLGLTNTASYKMNTVNSSGYRFGNRFSLSSAVYYRLPVAGLSVSPSLGLLYEHAASNKYEQAVVDGTGGYSLLLTEGLELNLNRINIGFNMQLPVRQQYAGGQTKLKSRGVLQLSFAL